MADTKYSGTDESYSLLTIKFNDRRIFGLDILRSLAILFVVIGHGGYLLESEYFKYINFFIFDGVSIFFVLSGFLIGVILIKILNNDNLSTTHLMDFWFRRWMRTLPNYFFVLFILLALNMLFTPRFVMSDKIYYIFFIQNFSSIHPNFFPEAWSLSIEEWFYLLIPTILFISVYYLRLKIGISIIVTASLIILFSIYMRYIRFNAGLIDDEESWNYLLRSQVITRLDSLLFGVLGAFFYLYRFKYWNKYKVAYFGVGIVILIMNKFNIQHYQPYGFYQSVALFSTNSFATLLLLPFLNSVKTGKGVFYKIITLISLISYSMYLTNLSVVQYWILESIDWELLISNSYLLIVLKYFAYWSFTLGISILMYKFIELPFLRLRDKIMII
ncbi:hypothetical protein A9Q93_03415 [Nonlabens dokdonensis]|uniref:Acyltransferase 3 domain-containing protein n=1 Tax=Nonlabens dokdonensis TaxID=328515 RepID=A0A1Z8B851_9FLAO|nr:acyltransferase [Nonlabens dokdonensis]OUS18678.1 hypothetical protein A9Q93_03415 [Nonlabens dokdonensis]